MNSIHVVKRSLANKLPGFNFWRSDTMRNITCSLAILSLALYTGAAFGQACGGTAGTISTSPSNVNGNTCTGTGGLVNVCQNQDATNGAGTEVWALTVGTNNVGVTVTITPTGFDPYVALINPNANNCNSSGPCSFDNQAATAVAVAGTLTTGAAAGTYFIVVGDTGSDAPGCGAYGLAVTGTLPVQLQKFSID
jgi:hypothetical protein